MIDDQIAPHQKDLADGLGAITAIMIFCGIHFRAIGCPADPAA